MKLEKWSEARKEIPYRTIPALIVKGEKYTDELQIIDIDKLFPEIGYDLLPLYQFKGYVIKEIIKRQGAVTKKRSKNKDYSHRQITIAYSIMDILITSENAAEILSEHSETRSIAKLLTKRINKASDLAKLSGNKTTDTKHLQDLIAAKRLISGMKDIKATNDISRIITAFETAYQNKY